MGHRRNVDDLAADEVSDILREHRTVYPPPTTGPLPPKQRVGCDMIHHAGHFTCEPVAQSRGPGFVPRGGFLQVAPGFFKEFNGHARTAGPDPQKPGQPETWSLHRGQSARCVPEWPHPKHVRARCRLRVRRWSRRGAPASTALRREGRKLPAPVLPICSRHQGASEARRCHARFQCLAGPSPEVGYPVLSVGVSRAEAAGRRLNDTSHTPARSGPGLCRRGPRPRVGRPIPGPWR